MWHTVTTLVFVKEEGQANIDTTETSFLLSDKYKSIYHAPDLSLSFRVKRYFIKKKTNGHVTSYNSVCITTFRFNNGHLLFSSKSLRSFKGYLINNKLSTKY